MLLSSSQGQLAVWSQGGPVQQWQEAQLNVASTQEFQVSPPAIAQALAHPGAPGSPLPSPPDGI